MKAELLCWFPRLNSVNDIINQCEVIESVAKTADWGMAPEVVANFGARDTSASPSPLPSSPLSAKAVGGTEVPRPLRGTAAHPAKKNVGNGV